MFPLVGNQSVNENGFWENLKFPTTATAFRRLGVALGQMVPPSGKFLLAADSQSLRAELVLKFIDGLRFSGAAVVDIGFLPIPMVYYAARRTRADGCAILSTSYDSADVNVDLKWLIGETVPDLSQLERLQKAVSQSESSGSRRKDAPDIRFLDVTFDYVAWLQDTWFDSPGRHGHVILDSCDGPWANRSRRYMQAVFPRLVFSDMSDEPERAKSIEEEVDHRRAELGITLGVDGGQISLVDGHGIPYSHDELNWLLIQSFGHSLEGEVFLHDTECPPLILSEAVRFGAKLQGIPPGDVSFRRAMMETSAIFGAESTGHHYFRAICGNNDALFSACWILDFLAQSGQSLAQFR